MGNLADSSRISLIAALDENGLIGSNGALPWYLPKDLARFKTMTLGKTVLMGRATFKSIGAALPGRRNVVLSRRCSAGIEGCDVFPTIALALSSVQPAEEVMGIGGAQVYAALLSRADTLHLTVLQHPQQLGLQIEGHVAHLVQEQRTLVSHLKVPDAVLRGTRKGTSHVAEQQ